MGSCACHGDGTPQSTSAEEGIGGRARSDIRGPQRGRVRPVRAAPATHDEEEDDDKQARRLSLSLFDDDTIDDHHDGDADDRRT